MAMMVFTISHTTVHHYLLCDGLMVHYHFCFITNQCDALMVNHHYLLTLIGLMVTDAVCVC